ncbi:pyridoxamine 5'-phosphate oxidase [Thorsellia kenyensis]|uniref:Pyridoxamine 5'-phosphate oxidase n=1 Tax=Thorsellia kenyensis TaxID=1549888 RepID=A0ABV6CAP5_9GAMM
MDNKQLASLRREYDKGQLTRQELPNNPLTLLIKWLEEAKLANIPDPSAFVLSTVNKQHQPSSRIVLMKALDELAHSITFFTNYESNKARCIDDNNQVSVLFPWYMLERQVIAIGIAKKTSIDISKDYFYSRPKESQIAAISSKQSTQLKSKKPLLETYHHLCETYAEEKVPFPNNWGGYEIALHSIEFWQGGVHRLHDRFKYELKDKNEGTAWEISRLSP